MKKFYLLTLIVIFSFYMKESTSQTQIWLEDFPYIDGTTQGSGTPAKWTLKANPADPDYFAVLSNQMEAVDIDGEGIWTTESIDISAYVDIQISLDIAQSGSMGSNDYLNVYYRIDGGTKEFVVGEYSGNFGSASPSVSGLFGSTLVIIARIRNNANTDIHNFDNVLVQGTIFSGPDNPTGFSATDVSDSQIDVSFTANGSSDNVLISWNTTGMFTTPSGAPPTVGSAFGGGTLLYNGTTSPVNHTSLTSCTQYYYAAWSYDGSDYSSGQLTNDLVREQISLPWSEDFEGITPKITFIESEPVINGSCGWTYDKTVDGQLRFGLYANGGTQAAAMDATTGSTSVNYLTATLDLTNFASSPYLELSFYHMAAAGEDAQSNDRVWIRGSDTDTWIQIYNLATNQGGALEWVYASGLDIDDALSTAGQTITSTFQLRFGQEDNNGFNQEGRAFDDILIEEHVIVYPDPPVSFSASEISSSQIDLSFTTNVATDDVIVVWNSSGTFTDPSGTPPAVGQTFAGGTVLYQGTTSPVNHTGLLVCRGYFYKVWSYDGSYYSTTGLSDDLFLEETVSLPWSEDFENVGPTTTFTSSESDVNGTCVWSYEKTAAGRLQFEEYANNGSQAAAMDANIVANSINHLTATLDLIDYTNSLDLVLSFYYMTPGGEEENANDKVWVRGSDTDPWLEIYDLWANQGASLVWVNVTGLDVDELIINAGQVVTSTFQVRFGQEDNNSFGGGEGYAFDDISITGTVSLAPSPPTLFTATIVSSSQIDLSYNTNVAADDVVIVWNNTGTFSDPVGAPPAVGQSFAGGTVLYKGTASPVNHIGLTSCDQYYYQAWSYDGSLYSFKKADDAYLVAPVSLPWSEGFEGVGPTVVFSASEEEINGTCKWSYEKTNDGELDFVSYFNSGSQGAAMDATELTNSINLLTTTLNLSNYADATDLELSFYHMAPIGEDASPNDRVWIRGSDSDPWIEIYNLAANQGGDEEWVQVTGLDIDATIAGVGQTITSSFQLRFGQQDNNGFTAEGRVFDDIGITGSLPATLTWTGTTSTDWNTTTNWDLGIIPNGEVDVIIPLALTNYPETNSGLGAVCNDLTIQSGAFVHVPANNTLSVNGTLMNYAGQSGLVIKSDASSMGSLIHNTAGVLATTDLYLSEDVWHYISSPISDGLSGMFTGIYLRGFDESTNDWEEWITALDVDLDVMKGYASWADDPATVNIQGTLNNGSQSIGVTCRDYDPGTESGGWNLVGNPFPSALDWEASGWTKTEVDNTIYFYSGAGGTANYSYYVGSGGSAGAVGTGDASRVIPPMQGFLVHVNDDAIPGVVNGTLGVTDDARVHANVDFYKSGDEFETPILRLSASNNADIEDETIIRFSTLAGPEHDGNYDAYKLYASDIPQIYSTTEQGTDLAINTLAAYDDETSISLGFRAPESGIFSLQLTEFTNFEDDTELYLEDLLTGVIQKLSLNSLHNFSASPDDDYSRFILHFGNPMGIGSTISNNVNVYSYGKDIHVDFSEISVNSVVVVYNMMGQQIITKDISGQKNNRINVPNGSGNYVVAVHTDKATITRKVLIK